MLEEYISYDGKKIIYKKWLAKQEIGIIQIAHGLGEMADYYEEFAEAANHNHFTVYLNEARGQGRTPAEYNEENIIEQYAHDLDTLNSKIKKTHQNQPIYLMCHSLGSLVGNIALKHYSRDWNKMIQIGLPYIRNVSGLINGIQEEIDKKGEDSPCVSIFSKIFGSVNDSFPKIEGGLAWITSDEERRNYFSSLPYTNVLYSNRFYRYFLVKSQEIQEEDIFKNTNKQLPIYILSGSDDQLSKDGIFSKSRAIQLRQRGFQHVDVKVYAGLRHSILQERNRKEVYGDLFEWLSEISHRTNSTYII